MASSASASVPQTQHTRDILRAALKGTYTPNGVHAEDCGPWAGVVDDVLRAYQAEGATGARRVFDAMARAKPDLHKLVSADDDALILKVLLDESPDDEGNAQCVNRVYRDRFLYCPAYGWLAWNGRYWDRNGAESALDRAIVDVLKRRRIAAVDAGKEAIVKTAIPSAHRVRDCKALFLSLVPASVDDFDRDPDLLNVANGVLDLRDGRLAPHAPEQRFTYALSVDYDATADYRAWVDFLRGALSDGDLVPYLQRAIGYSLTGHTSEECLWYVFGPPRAGKGTFTETLLALLPAPLGKEVDFVSFTAKRIDTNNFDLAPLKPARFVVASEGERHETLNASKIKVLTGGNGIYCCFKHQTHFSYRPQFKIWLVSNHPLNVDVDDDAAWYRVKVIDFPNGHSEHEDKVLKPRLRGAANLRGVLRWAVEGAAAWYASMPAGLVTPEPIKAATRSQRDALDFVQTWLDECCDTTKQGAWSGNDRVYGSYSQWCKQNGVAAKAQRGLSNALKLKGFAVGERETVGNTRFRGVRGLRILDNSGTKDTADS